MSEAMMSGPDTARPATPTETIDHVADRAQLALVQAEQIEVKLFGCHPAPCDVIDASDTPTLEGAIERARIVVEERLLPLLKSLSERL